MPRLALAIPEGESDPSPVGLALLASLSDRGLRVQHFRARACPLETRAIGEITGLPGRHLDSWLMTPGLCRTIFARGARAADLAVIEGTMRDPRAGAAPSTADDPRCRRPGELATIVEALDAPIVAVLPCDDLDSFHLPALPPGAEGVILDGVRDGRSFRAIRRMVELVTGVPVVAALDPLPAERAALRVAARDWALDAELIGRLARGFTRHLGLDRLLGLAGGRALPTIDPEVATLPPSPANGRRFRVAFAQDEAFGGYFPNTLETLEALGAELVEFSPLADGELPRDVGLVIIGCGMPDRFAEALAGNLSMINSLRCWARLGRPIFAEGGGAAFLSKWMRLGHREVPGVGVLPVDAILRVDPEPPGPVRRVFDRDAWLGPAGTIVRGYHSNRWRFEPATAVPGDGSGGPLTVEGDIVAHRNAVGSLIHLHLAALPQVVSAFAGLRAPSLAAIH